MAFMLYKKQQRDGKLFYLNENKGYSLAGNSSGLIYPLWEKRGKPTEQGWTITADDILRQYDEKCTLDSHSLIIDFHPSANYRIGLIGLDRIHLYTFGDPEYVEWTPIMLELHDVFGVNKKITREEKINLIAEFEPNSSQKIVEFLYLNGDDYSWNWGRNGTVNAAFLHEETRNYFRQYF